MEKYEHLKLPLFKANIERQKRGGGGGFKMPEGRNKSQFSQQAQQKSEQLSQTCADLKARFPNIDSKLIFTINIDQSLAVDAFEQILAGMDIHVLSVAEGKKGIWVVFSDDQNLKKFKDKLKTYGSEGGANYDFFHAIESFGDIPVEEKIGEQLKGQPLSDSAEFMDIELWKMDDPQKNTDFIAQLKESYPELSQFKISDQLITKSFVLLRVKLTKQVFDDIIQLKEISRIDRPAIAQFNHFEMMSPDIQELQFSAPDNNAMGILIIDSGIVSNHPMLENCVGGEENFQTGEQQTQDTVGHGTAVAGCAAYGDIGQALKNKQFTPSNWLFSAKVMYAENDLDGKPVNAIYDPEKLLEHQFKDAIESFLSNPEYHIKVVNISLGNAHEVWHKHYSRQLPLAALIDELAFTFPHVVFIVSTGNQSSLKDDNSIADLIENYPKYLLDNDEFNLINPATAALALTIGSIAPDVQIEQERYGVEQIKTAIAQAHQPSPFTRTGLGINGMIKPELVEYGGNMILSEQYGRIVVDKGGQLPLLNKQVTNPIIRFDVGSSFSAPKVAHLAGRIANQFPDKSANFIKNMLLAGADYPFLPSKEFYGTANKKKAEQAHFSVAGYGLSQFDRAIHSFDNRAVLWDEGQITMNQLKVYSLQLPELFFTELGKKKIIVTLTFTPETRATRGDSYLGNRMEFHLFHSVNPQVLIEKYGVIENNTDQESVPEDLKQYEIDFFPGSNTRKAGCHQKAWKLYQREPKHRPESPISLVLLNVNKWINDERRVQDYCISVVFEHEKEINLYTELQANVQARARVK
ncbi:MAG: S8 family peptidase [Gammaproteobacteria bacterium]|nr:S8 family peptidase [Gammaproteobacteria bacterium]